MSTKTNLEDALTEEVGLPNATLIQEAVEKAISEKTALLEAEYESRAKALEESFNERVKSIHDEITADYESDVAKLKEQEAQMEADLSADKAALEHAYTAMKEDVEKDKKALEAAYDEMNCDLEKDKEELLAKHEKLTADIGGFLDLVAEEFINENKPAIISQLKLESVENVLGVLRSALQENYINIPAVNKSVVEELESKNSELEKVVNEKTRDVLRMRAEHNKLIKENKILKLTEGMAIGEASVLSARLNNLALTSEFDSLAESIKADVVSKRTSTVETTPSPKESVQSAPTANKSSVVNVRQFNLV